MKNMAPYKPIIFFLFTAIWLSVLLPENSSALPQNRVKTTGFQRQNTMETAIILTENVTRTTHFVLHNPERIVVDIHQAFFPGISDSKKTSGNLISGIRTNQNQKDVVRVVVDMNEDTPYFFDIKKESVNNVPGIKVQVSQNEIAAPDSGNIVEDSSPDLAFLGNALPDDIFEDTETANTHSDFAISGLIRVRSTFQTNENDAVENNATFRNRILVEGKYKNEVTLSVLSDYLYFGSENQNEDYDINLYEAKWGKTEKKYAFSIGKQIIRWGKADQLSPVDTLNPEDFREFIVPDYEERKIPVWMANARLLSDHFTLEGVIIPFFEKSKIDYFGTNWSVFGHMKKELQTSLPTPALKTYVNNLSVHETDPDNETEFALRLHTTIKAIDLGLTFHHMIEDTPYFKSFPIKNLNINGDFSNNTIAATITPSDLTNETIEVEYQRTKAVGFEFETIWSDIGFRGEAVWKENQSFLTSSLTSYRHPTITYMIGADYTTRDNTYFNIQFLHSHIHDFSPDILYFDQNSFSFLGEFRVDLLSDWLQGALKYNIALNNNSHYLSPYLKYTYFANLECIAGGGLFFGDKDTWLGRFRDYDFLYLDIIYWF